MFFWGAFTVVHLKSIILGYGDASLGDYCIMFSDCMMISSSRVSLCYDPWSWDHHSLLKYSAPVTQWCDTTSQKNGDLNLHRNLKHYNRHRTSVSTCQQWSLVWHMPFCGHNLRYWISLYLRNWVLRVVIKIFLTAADASSKVWFLSMEITNYQETIQQINEQIFYNTQHEKGYVATDEAIILFVHINILLQHLL